MLMILALVASVGLPGIPDDAVLMKAWRNNSPYCTDDLDLPKEMKRALRVLERRGISQPAARHLILGCTSPYDPTLAISAMRAALVAGPRLPVSIVVRKILVSRQRRTAEDRALARELEEPERTFAAALLDDDPAPIPKLEAALAALSASAPVTERDERRVCLAGALARAGKVDEALAVFPAPPAYPGRRGEIEAQRAARAGDAPRAKHLLETAGKTRAAKSVPCWRTFANPECAVARGLIAAGRVEVVRTLSIDDCGALAGWAETHQSPFDAYVAVVESRSDSDDDSIEDWIRAPRLLAKLGRPELARSRLEAAARVCTGKDGSRQPPAGGCAAIQQLLVSLPAASQGQTADPALLARLRAPPRWREYEVVPAPRGKPTAHDKRLRLPDHANVVFSAVDGARAVAVALSRDVDPRGEVSAGGYVVYLSDDAGKTWRGPLHSGFAAGFPFYVKEATTAKAFDGDVLQLPVDVQEIDPESITFPPVALRTLRTERDRLVRIPIATLEKDSDGDDLTDLLEERLGTDPNRADTDGDGVPDAWDPLPLEKSAAKSSSEGRFAAAVLDRPKSEALVHRPDSKDFQVGPPGRPPGLGPWPSLPTRFIEGWSAPPDLGGRTIRLLPEAVQAYAKKLGPIYPIELEIVVEPGGRRAIVDVNEHWRGVTYLVEERPDGTFKSRTLSEWIT